MPELPEVETVKNGLTPHILNKSITNIHIRRYDLRWPIPNNLEEILHNQILNRTSRRGKYMIWHFNQGDLIIHLGMTGTIKILSKDTPMQKHEHVEFIFDDNTCLRYEDTRRFGAILWEPTGFEKNPLISHLGPEPLSEDFNGKILHTALKSKSSPIKTCIMDSQIVVGVGNIYANEALFKANIHPQIQGKALSLSDCNTLATCIKNILKTAISQGGSTIKDFKNSEGKPGYFAQSLKVYNQAGKPCPVCNTTLSKIKISGRQTVYCTFCQPLSKNQISK